MKTVGYDSFTSWLVSVCCAIIFCLTALPYRLAGLIFVLITDYYEIERKTASIPILLFLLIRCLGGPLFALLGEKFGLEVVTLVGCVLAAVGFGLCFFAETIVGFTLLLGIVFGIGLALSTVLVPSILKKHFKNNHTTANGISHAGICLGALLFPPAATFLVDLYGVPGAFLVMSGIMLNAIPLGIYVLKAGALQDTLIIHQNQQKRRIQSVEKGNDDTTQQVNTENSHCNQTIPPVSQENPTQINFLDKKIIRKTDSFGFSVEPDTKDQNRIEVSILQNENYTQNTENVKQIGNIQDSHRNKRRGILYGFSVFKDISYLIIMLNIGLATYVTSLFWTTMIDYSRDKGISRTLEIYFLMLQPLVDLVGRAGLGWVTDHGYLTLQNFTMLCYSQMALSMFFIMWTNSFVVMMAGSCYYALTSGAVSVLYPIIIFKCINKDHQTMAIASRYSLYGALIFTSSPLIGYFRENLGSYDGLYIIFIVLCIVCAAVIPLIFKFNKHRTMIES